MRILLFGSGLFINTLHTRGDAGCPGQRLRGGWTTSPSAHRDPAEEQATLIAGPPGGDCSRYRQGRVRGGFHYGPVAPPPPE